MQEAAVAGPALFMLLLIYYITPYTRRRQSNNAMVDLSQEALPSSE